MLQPEEKPFVHVNVTDTTSSEDPVSTSSVWSLLPDSNKLDSTMPSLPIIDRSTIGDVTAVYGGQGSYYGAGYPAAGYGVYGSTPSTAYYQQMASGLTQNSAARFPYSITPAASAYYGTSYTGAAAANFDYSAYSSQYYNTMRNGYYGNLAATTNSYQTPSTLSDSSSDLSSFTLKAETKKVSGKSAKKKKGSCSPSENQYSRIFVWDLSDICVYSAQSIAIAMQKASYASPAFSRLQQLVPQVSSLAFPAGESDECELINVEDAAIEEQEQVPVEGQLPETRNGGVEIMRRMATKYITMKQIYMDYGCKLDALLDRCCSSTKKEEFNEYVRQIDMILGNRKENTKRCLELVTTRSSMSSEKYANVVICSEGLVNGISQVLLSGLAPFVPIDNIYSCYKVGKEAVLERIMNRFGKKCSYVVVTGNQETTLVSRKESMAVWPVIGCDDLEKLYTAQNNYLLGRPI